MKNQHQKRCCQRINRLVLFGIRLSVWFHFVNKRLKRHLILSSFLPVNNGDITGATRRWRNRLKAAGQWLRLSFFGCTEKQLHHG